MYKKQPSRKNLIHLIAQRCYLLCFVDGDLKKVVLGWRRKIYCIDGIVSLVCLTISLECATEHILAHVLSVDYKTKFYLLNLFLSFSLSVDIKWYFVTKQGTNHILFKLFYTKLNDSVLR